MSTNKKILIGLGAVGLFYFFFLGDYLQYRNVLDEQTEYSCDQYFSEYPNGWFIEEVRLEEALISRDIEVVRYFLYDYPATKYLYKIEELRLQLWNTEIDYYNQTIAPYIKSDAVSFFRNLLYYMRDNKQSEILLNLTGNVNVKNYEDFPSNVISDIDRFFAIESHGTVSSQVIDLKSSYSQGSLSSYESIVSKSIEESFSNILKLNFIKISTNQSDYEDKRLQINISYKIVNQMFEDSEFPNVWIYTEADPVTQLDEFISYFLGVNIYFDFELSIPNIDSYNFSVSSDPSELIEGFDDISECYQIMTSQNFTDFANKINTNFGIK